MSINFDDAGQMMNGGKRIPVDTQEAFAATREACVAVYAASGRPFDADADQQLERRVLGGMTTNQIVQVTLQDRKARFNES